MPGDTVSTWVTVVVHVKVMLCVKVVVGRRVRDAVADGDAVGLLLSLWVGKELLAVLVPQLRVSVLAVVLCDALPPE